MTTPLQKRCFLLSVTLAGETIEKEVTLEEFCKAERAAGFHPKLAFSDPLYMSTPATSGFDNGFIRGSVRYGEESAAAVPVPPSESLANAKAALASFHDYRKHGGEFPLAALATLENVVESMKLPLRAARSAAPVDRVHWDLFPSYLIDHTEGSTVTEENLQSWLSRMLEDPDYLRVVAEREQAAHTAPEEPARLDIEESKRYLIDFMMRHFTDKTYQRYILGNAEVGRNKLAGDFAWQMARALRRIEAGVALLKPA